MALELAEVAAGLPMAASLAVASGITTLREGRRRASLNEAMHELRRPLQVLSLALPAESGKGEVCESSLRIATAALERLEREINGGPEAPRLRPVSVRPLVEAAVRRWKAPAALRGRSLRLRWRAEHPLLIGDEMELAQALDNLISNALRHGGGEVEVDVRESGRRLRLAVVDSGGADGVPGGSRRIALHGRIDGRRRHGHGLRVVARAARRHGGSFQLRRSPRRTEARIELPLPEGEAR
ncbi:MAG: sensor histidine kinase [Solirubrobacterales bacterium]